MTIRPDLLLAYEFPEARQTYARRDAILYALGVGLGADPTDPADLSFLLEDRLETLPTFAVTLGSPGMWIRAPQFGVDFAKLVHYEQAAAFHRPLPPEAEIVAHARVLSVTDRGQGKGAVVVLERRIADAANGEPYCTLQQTLLLRGDGGFGGEPPDTAALGHPGPRVATPSRASRSIRARRSSIGSRATGIRCTQTQKPQSAPASNARSCMGSPPTPSRASRSRALSAARPRPLHRSAVASPELSSPATA